MADYDLQYQDTHIDALLATANELKTAGYIFRGVATPSTNPGTPTEKIAYIASTSGVYTFFGGLVKPSGLHVLLFDGTTWTATALDTMDMDFEEIGYNFGYGPSIIGWISSAGVWIANSNSSSHYLVPVVAGEKIIIEATTTIATGYAWLTSNSTPVHGQAAPLSQYAPSVISVPIGESKTDVAPLDAHYLCIWRTYNNVDRTPKSVKRIISLREQLLGDNKIITPTKSNYYILTSSYPSLTASQNYYTSDYIQVGEGDIIYIPQLYATPSVIAISGYSSQSQSDNVEALRIRGEATGSLSTDYGFIVPKGVSYFRICASYISQNGSLSYYHFTPQSGAIYAELARQMDAKRKQSAINIERDAAIPLNAQYSSIRPRKACIIFQMDALANFFANSAAYTAKLREYGVNYCTLLCLNNTFSTYIN